MHRTLFFKNYQNKLFYESTYFKNLVVYKPYSKLYLWILMNDYKNL